MSLHFVSKEFTAKEVQAILRALCGGTEKIGLAQLNYYSRTNLVPSSGKTLNRGRFKYTYSDLILLCWLFRMKREGLPVNRFRRGLDYLRKRLPKLLKNPQDMVLLTDGRQLFLKHRVEEKGEIAEAITGMRSGQYVWVYAIGSLIEEIDLLIQNPAVIRGNFGTTESRQKLESNADTKSLEGENGAKGTGLYVRTA